MADDNQIEKINSYLAIYEEIGYSTQFVGINDDQHALVQEWGKGLIVLSGQSGVGKSTF